MATTTTKRMKPGNNLRTNGMKTSQVRSKRKVGQNENASTTLSSSTDENDNSWTAVTSKNQKRREKGLEKRNEKLVTGSRKIVGGSLRAATRTADVFIGRVDNDVSEDEIKDYIKTNFNVDIYAVRKLNIRSEIYAAFKVNVKISDRDKLFDAELWPEDIIVNKFYNRYHRSFSRRGSNS